MLKKVARPGPKGYDQGGRLLGRCVCAVGGSRWYAK